MAGRVYGWQPDLTLSPVPRWDLYPNDKVLQGSVQTSRSCPFSCEFCDVIQYVGRKQRHKSVQQVLDELDVLYRLGYRKILLADDDFAAYRERTKELLIGIRVWNESQTEGRVSYTPEEFEAILKQANSRSLEQSDKINIRKQTLYKKTDHGFIVGYGDRQYQVKGIQWGDTQLKAPLKKKKSSFLPEPVPIDSVEVQETDRIKTGLAEFDRVLGGGLVEGSLLSPYSL